jgi:hypothetical protein
MAAAAGVQPRRPALNYAAELQWWEGQKIAGRVAFGAIGAALLVGVAIGSSGGASGLTA